MPESSDGQTSGLEMRGVTESLEAGLEATQRMLVKPPEHRDNPLEWGMVQVKPDVGSVEAVAGAFSIAEGAWDQPHPPMNIAEVVGKPDEVASIDITFHRSGMYDRIGAGTVAFEQIREEKTVIEDERQPRPYDPAIEGLTPKLVKDWGSHDGEIAVVNKADGNWVAVMRYKPTAGPGSEVVMFRADTGKLDYRPVVILVYETTDDGLTMRDESGNETPMAFDQLMEAAGVDASEIAGMSIAGKRERALAAFLETFGGSEYLGSAVHSRHYEGKGDPVAAAPEAA